MKNNPAISNANVHSSLSQLDEIRVVVKKALSFEDNDPETFLMHARKAGEAICRQLFIEKIAPNPGKAMLEDLIKKLSDAGALPNEILPPLVTIQRYGNVGAHDHRTSQIDANSKVPIDTNYIKPCAHALRTLEGWYASTTRSASEKPVPTRASHLMAKGDLLMQSGKYREALETFRLAWRQLPGDASIKSAVTACYGHLIVCFPLRLEGFPEVNTLESLVASLRKRSFAAKFFSAEVVLSWVESVFADTVSYESARDHPGDPLDCGCLFLQFLHLQ